MSEELRARLEREVARNREEAILDDRAAIAARNADGAATFRAWASAKRQRADDIEAALSMLSFASSAAGQREGCEAKLRDILRHQAGRTDDWRVSAIMSLFLGEAK